MPTWEYCVIFCIPQCSALDLPFPEETEVISAALIQESNFQKLRHIFYTKLDIKGSGVASQSWAHMQKK